MAERRMFAKSVIDSDEFLDMPLSAQALYFHLAMHADDDGFVKNPKKIQRSVGCAGDDARLLIAKQFIIPFDTGVVVIRHWKIHNYIQKDRYRKTVYQEERGQLELGSDLAYTTLHTSCIQAVSNTDTQDRLELELELGKDNNSSSSGSRACARAREDEGNPFGLTAEQMEDLQRIGEAYEADIGLIPSSAMEGFRTYTLEHGLSADVVIKAIQAAAENNVRTWSYVRSVLDKCVNEKIVTPEDWQQNELRRKTQRSSRTGAGQGAQTSWIDWSEVFKDDE